jgi:DNA topoisomerase VI subunit A
VRCHCDFTILSYVPCRAIAACMRFALSDASIVSIGRGQELQICRFALPDLMWLGVHHNMLEDDCDPSDMQALSPLDVRKLERLLGEDTRVPATWHAELDLMLQGGCKCEIEAAHKLRGMSAFCAMLVEDMAMYAGL